MTYRYLCATCGLIDRTMDQVKPVYVCDGCGVYVENEGFGVCPPGWMHLAEEREEGGDPVEDLNWCPACTASFKRQLRFS